MELRGAALILVVQLVVGHLDLAGDVVEQQHTQTEAAQLRHAEIILVLVVEGLEVGLAGRAGIGGGGQRQHQRLGGPLLGAAAVERIDQLGWRRDAVDQRLVELLADEIVAQRRLELRQGHVLGRDILLVEQRVEGALVVLEGAVGADQLVERVVADREAEMADLEIDQLAIDEPLQGAVDDAELLQLLAVERGAVQRLPPALGVLAHRLAQLLHTDLAVADGGGDAVSCRGRGRCRRCPRRRR